MSEKKRIVVKLGTSTLTHPSGRLNLRKMEKIVRALADLQGKGNDIILVTSAAISAGTAKMRLSERPSELRMKMAIAAVGQARLMHIYDTLFSEYNQHGDIADIQCSHSATTEVTRARAIEHVELVPTTFHSENGGENRIAVLLLHGVAVTDGILCIYGTTAANNAAF